MIRGDIQINFNGPDLEGKFKEQRFAPAHPGTVTISEDGIVDFGVPMTVVIRGPGLDDVEVTTEPSGNGAQASAAS